MAPTAPAASDTGSGAAPASPPRGAGTRELTDRVGELVAQRARALAAQGRSIADLGDTEELAQRMVAALPTQHAWDERLGPFYDTAGLVTWLGISRQALADRVRRGTLLACRTADGHLVYPALQFARDGVVRAGVVDAIGHLTRAGAEGWAVAVWLTTPSDAFEGHSAVDFLVVHRSSAAAVEHVREVAAADARGWGR
ncbi:MAG TPA: hypothetical protein VFJ12_09310 [Segeticoccus sp.]|jgi:hypothetical protein|nr:hypothetical protein [Segeticoccus sp.]